MVEETGAEETTESTTKGTDSGDEGKDEKEVGKTEREGDSTYDGQESGGHNGKIIQGVGTPQKTPRCGAGGAVQREMEDLVYKVWAG